MRVQLVQRPKLFTRAPASAEADTIEGWLAYGAALNEGRGLFASDELFGQWLVTNNLSDTVQAERAAAMWAAANPPEFDTARQASNARTVRGIYAKRRGTEGLC